MTSPSMMRSFSPLMLSKSARIISVVSNTVLAAAAEHERHVIGERTRHALAAAKARGVKLGNPEQAKINRVKAAAGLKRCARTSSAASRLAAHRAVPSQPISHTEWRPMVSDAGPSSPPASRPMIDRGAVLPGVKVFPPGRESLSAQRGTGKPLAALGTLPLQHCPEVPCDARAHSGRTIE